MLIALEALGRDVAGLCRGADGAAGFGEMDTVVKATLADQRQKLTEPALQLLPRERSESKAAYAGRIDELAAALEIVQCGRRGGMSTQPRGV